MIRHCRNGKTAFFVRGVQVVTTARISVTSGQVDGEICHDGNDSNYGGEHGYDEPRSSICGLWGGLSDPHRVDESVRDHQEELHVFFDNDSTK
jgi:hypothetical protein